MIDYNPNMDIPNYQDVTPFAQLVLKRPKWLNQKVFEQLVDKYLPKEDRGYKGIRIKYRRIKDAKIPEAPGNFGYYKQIEYDNYGFLKENIENGN